MDDLERFQLRIGFQKRGEDIERPLEKIRKDLDERSNLQGSKRSTI
jgi:hypothetical protein